MSKLIPIDILEQIPALYSTENEQYPTAYIRLYTPDSTWSWYITEYDPEERLCFGLVKGFEVELGYFSLEELEGLKGPMNMPIQMDKSFKPSKLKKHSEGDSIREILSWDDIARLEEPFYGYMTEIKNSLGSDREWNFEENGHWVIIDDIKELESPIKGTNFELSSLNDGLFESIEAVELKNGVYELIFLLGNEFGVGVLIQEKDMLDNHKHYLQTYLAA